MPVLPADVPATMLPAPSSLNSRIWLVAIGSTTHSPYTICAPFVEKLYVLDVPLSGDGMATGCVFDRSLVSATSWPLFKQAFVAVTVHEYLLPDTNCRLNHMPSVLA